ncbi:MAG: PAS domain-containing protein, partial [Gemmatimonadetes bacterium]|nr:PAS domain-containing protein [Gemmatimonadota bacterium]
MNRPAARPESVDLLVSLAEILRTEPADVLPSRIPGVLARYSGGFAAYFRLHADGAVAQEWWHPVNEALTEPLAAPFRETILEAVAGDNPVHHAPEAKDGTNHLWVCILRDGERNAGALCIAVPEAAWSGDPRDLAVLRAAAEILQGHLNLTRRLAQARAEREQQDRYFKTLDQQLRILDRERQKFVAVTNQNDMATFSVDELLEVRWTNRSTAERLCGDDNPGRWIGKPLQEAWDRLGLIGPVAGSHTCPVARALRGNEVIHQEFQLTVAGEPRTLYLTALPVTAPDGRADEALVMIQDLSNLESLRRSESRYRLLFERSLDAMLMVDPHTWRILLSNPEASRLLGWENQTMRGVAMQRLHDTDDWEAAREDYGRILEGGQAVTAERVLKSTQGETIIVNMSGMRFDLDGSPVALFEFQDVTEKRRLETELRHSQKMEAIGRLAGGVAHDFNNLLAVIQGQSEMLINKLDDHEDKLSRTAQSVRKAAVRGSLLTKQLLAFSRKDVHKAEIVDVRDVVADIEAMVCTL